MLHQLTVILTVIVVLVQSQHCPHPPAQWCSSAHVAKQCGVFEACLRNIWSRPGPEDAAKVPLGVYYESLCPDCQIFIKEQLYPTFQKVPELMSLEMVPYGNAEETQEGDTWKFTCQHGPVECEGNLIETCAIFKLQEVKKYMDFINCIEEEGTRSGFEQPAKKCAAKLGFDYGPIDNCVKSTLGNKIQHLMAMKTEKQQVEYVPWITLDGKHNDDIQTRAEADLLKFVCDTYTGTKPDACKQSSTMPTTDC